MTREEARKILFNAHICRDCFTPMRRMTVGPLLTDYACDLCGKMAQSKPEISKAIAVLKEKE